MDIVGYIFSLIVTIETIYIISLRDERKRLKTKLRRRTWEARGRDSTLMEKLEESELEDYMMQVVEANRGSISMEYLEEVLLKAIGERVLKDRGEPAAIDMIATLANKLTGDKG